MVNVGIAVIISFHLIGIVLAVQAILIARTPPAAIGWALGLIVLPYVAIPLFLIFGQSRFSGYITAGSGESKELDAAKAEIVQRLQGETTDLDPEYRDLAHVAQRLTGLSATTGNQLKLLLDGKEAFLTMFRELDEAQVYVVIQFYIIRDDELGRELARRLAAACRRGVKVWVLFDSVGSKELPWEWCEQLRRQGAKVQPFITNRKLGVRFQINFRNHRKLVLIDGRVAFIGGLNVGNEYLGRNKYFGSWRDTHVRITGPAIEGLRLAFLEDWNYAAGEIPELPSCAVSQRNGTMRAISFASHPTAEIELCPTLYLEIIRSAKQRLWIASPYLVPDVAMRIALQHTALRGVDVRILLPGKPDHLLPWLTSFTYYPAMQLAGIKLFRMREGFMHQKVLLADDSLALVGSVNLDHRSFFLNFETGIIVNDRAFARQVAEMLEQDFAKSSEVDLSLYEKSSLLFRIKVRLASLMSPEQ